ncbi:MAG: LysM peptidoglycan-binding domain-containing protein [Bacteroidetes bacterium]|nr:LysM peptidoglycan-binding domain-containing protein [Bacteroidota bacterium]MDA0874334.1 LysM peptidoglycan-binding domain-containing protein [Bacteroidota bacterium]
MLHGIFDDVAQGTRKERQVGLDAGVQGLRLQQDGNPPATDTLVTLRIVPQRRTVQLVGSGGVRIGAAAGAAAPVTVRRNPVDEAVTQDEEAPEGDVTPSSRESFDEREKHTVTAGETLSRLARRYYEGSTAHWVRLWLANRSILADPDLLLPGMRLTLPPPGPLTPEEQRALRDRDR